MNTEFSESQIKSAHNANALGFVSQILASGVAKSPAEAADRYKRASTIVKAAQVRRDFVRNQINDFLKANPAAA